MEDWRTPCPRCGEVDVDKCRCKPSAQSRLAAIRAAVSSDVVERHEDERAYVSVGGVRFLLARVETLEKACKDAGFHLYHVQPAPRVTEALRILKEALQ